MENLGGYWDDGRSERRFLSPEAKFEMDMAAARDFIKNRVTRAEFDLLMNNLDKVNHRLHRNPALLILGFAAYVSRGKAVQSIMTDKDLQPILRENNIRTYDLIRYMRYFSMHANVLSM